jgi:predicted transcriptional regulator
MLTSEQVRAARALLRIEQKDLAEASEVSLPSIRRPEAQPGPLAAQPRTVSAIRRALEAAGVQFIDQNGNGPGDRLRDRIEPKEPATDLGAADGQ